MKCPDCGALNLAGEETCEACSAPLSLLALPRPKGGVQSRILEGTIADLKPKDALSVPANGTVESAIHLMRERRMGCVLVTDGARLAGIFTERDLLIKVAGLKEPKTTKVSDAMTPDPQLLGDSDPVALAFHTMAVRGERHVAVARENGSLGIISARDLLRFLCEQSA